MCKEGRNTKCISRIHAYNSFICMSVLYFVIISFTLNSCQDSVPVSDHDQVVELMLSDLRLVQTSYSACMDKIKLDSVDASICKSDISVIKKSFKKIEGNLKVLANLRDVGAISDETYQQSIGEINGELEVVRSLSAKLKEKGISFSLK